MRENEFEKQVQQKMGELDLGPSAEVWAAVERRIRKEKKRRFIFWWLPLLFLLLGGGITTAIWFNNKKENNTKTIVAKELESGTQPASLENDSASETSISIKENNNEEETVVDKNSIEKRIGNKLTDKATEEKKQFANPPYSLKKKNNKIISVQGVKKNGEVKIVRDMSLVNNTRLNDRAPDVVVDRNDKEIVNNNEQVVANIKPDSEISENEIEKSAQQKEVQISDSIKSIPVENVPNKKLKKWDWGITISAGRSSLSNGLSLFNKSIYADALSYQSPSTVGGSGGSLNNQSLILPSFSWSAGFYIKKSISKKLDVNLGLGYSYLATKFNIGSRVDSIRIVSNRSSGSISINNFYRPSGSGNSSVYTNGYHFINLSGTVSWRIIQRKKLKLYWENGLSYERLMGSSMLHFDNSLPGYYKDNNQIRKNHVVLSTGFSIPVSQRLIINPFVSYSLTPVLRNSNATNANFNNLGMRMKLLLKKKN